MTHRDPETIRADIAHATRRLAQQGEWPALERRLRGDAWALLFATVRSAIAQRRQRASRSAASAMSASLPQ